MGKRLMNGEKESMKVRKNMEARLTQMIGWIAILQKIAKSGRPRLPAKFIPEQIFICVNFYGLFSVHNHILFTKVK